MITKIFVEKSFGIRFRRRGARRLLQCTLFPCRKVLYPVGFYHFTSWTFLPKLRDTEISNRNEMRSTLFCFAEFPSLVFSFPRPMLPLHREMWVSDCSSGSVYLTLKSNTLAACQQTDCGHWSA